MPSTLLLPLLILVAPWSAAVAQDAGAAAPALTLSALQTSAEVGRGFLVTCSLPTEGCAANWTAAAIQWVSPNGTLLSTSVGGGGGRLSAVNGTLNCSGGATLEDTGNYNCTLDACGLSATAYVLVYEMPSYVTSLAVLYSIDGALAIVAVVLCTLSLVVTRKSASGIV